MSDKILGTLAIVLVVGFVVGVFWLGSTVDWSSAVSASETVAEPTEKEKPITSIECDWTGFMSGSIIEEKAQEGYFYSGRTATWYCDNAMVFQLRETPHPTNVPMVPTNTPEMMQR